MVWMECNLFFILLFNRRYFINFVFKNYYGIFLYKFLFIFGYLEKIDMEFGLKDLNIFNINFYF